MLWFFLTMSGWFPPGCYRCKWCHKTANTYAVSVNNTVIIACYCPPRESGGALTPWIEWDGRSGALIKLSKTLRFFPLTTKDAEWWDLDVIPPDERIVLEVDQYGITNDLRAIVKAYAERVHEKKKKEQEKSVTQRS